MINGLGSFTFNEFSGVAPKNSMVSGGEAITRNQNVDASSNLQSQNGQTQATQTQFAQLLQGPADSANLENKALKVGQLIEEFVEEMSEKYNLSPAQILQAVDLKDPKQLFLNPEQSAQNIVQSLGLTPSEKGEALAAIKDLLAEMKKTMFGSETQPVNKALVGMGTVEALSQRKPVSEMSFFDVQPKFGRTPSSLRAFETAAPAGLESRLSMNDLNSAGGTQQAPSAQELNPSLVSANSNDMNQLMAEANYQQNTVRPASTDSVLSQMNFESQLKESLSAKSKLGGARGNQAYGIFGSQTQSVNGASLYPSSVESLETLGENKNQEESLEEWLQGSLGREGSLAQGSQNQNSGVSDFQKLLTTAGIAQPERIENMESMIQSARVMASQGGGQMDVELRPEGLGKVQLKVSVEDGQVQIQMLADNQKAQELLRDGLEDLKSQLAGQKLNIDKISVDVSQDIGQQQDFARQNSSQDQQRQFAQGFMQQQREERDQLRQGWSAIPSSRRAEQARPNIQPTQVSTRSYDGRLNLVA